MPRHPRALRRNRSHLASSTPFTALVVATMAVTFAGSATAAGMISGAQIKDGTLTGRDVRNGSVGGVDVADGTLGPIEFSSLPVGPPGPRGPRGPGGPPGSSGLTYVVQPHAVVAGGSASWAAPCPTGTSAVSGGASSDSNGAVLSESAALADGRGWWVGLRNTTSTDTTGYAWAICLRGTR